MSVAIEEISIDEAPTTPLRESIAEAAAPKTAPPLDERAVRELLAREAWRLERLAAD
jgi:hypothetical protein